MIRKLLAWCRRPLQRGGRASALRREIAALDAHLTTVRAEHLRLGKRLAALAEREAAHGRELDLAVADGDAEGAWLAQAHRVDVAVRREGLVARARELRAALERGLARRDRLRRELCAAQLADAADERQRAEAGPWARVDRALDAL